MISLFYFVVVFPCTKLPIVDLSGEYALRRGSVYADKANLIHAYTHFRINAFTHEAFPPSDVHLQSYSHMTSVVIMATDQTMSDRESWKSTVESKKSVARAGYSSS